GAEIIKLYGSGGHGFPEEPGHRNLSNDEMVAAVNAAHEIGRRVRAHVVYRDLVLECIEAGVDIIDHGDEVDMECVEAMAAHGTSWAPTLSSSTRWLESGRR